MKRLLLFLLCIGILLTGCSARAQELENSAIIKALAFDRLGQDYEITAYIAGAENQRVTVVAESVAEGLSLLNTGTERRIFLGKNQIILISSKIREIDEILSVLYSSQEARVESKVLIMQGNAKDALYYEGLYRETSTDLEKTLENAAENSNYPEVTLYGAVNGMAAEEGCCVLPIAKMENENLILKQCAVYRKGKILQTLTEQQILGCALLCEKEHAYLSLHANSYALRNISVKNTQDSETTHIRINCTYRMLTGVSGNLSRAEIEQELKKAVEEVCALAGKLNANFLEIYPLDFAKNIRISVSAEPASNDYPQEGLK